MRVSVLIRAHNRKEYLREALESTHFQTVQPDEVFVSTNFGDPGYIREMGAVHLSHGEGGSRFGEFLDRSTGDVLAFLDDDDIWKPHHVSHIHEAFAIPQVIFYKCGASNFTDGSEFTDHAMHLFMHPESDRRILVTSRTGKALASLLHEDDMDNKNSTMAIRRNIMLEHRDLIDHVIHSTDGQIFACAWLSSGILFRDFRHGVFYRVHDGISSAPGFVQTWRDAMERIAEYARARGNVELFEELWGR